MTSIDRISVDDRDCVIFLVSQISNVVECISFNLGNSVMQILEI
jgi:hypothetical protein